MFQEFHAVYNNNTKNRNNEETTKQDIDLIESHPVLRLLQHTLTLHDLSPHYFLKVLDGRERDLNVKQYLTMDDFVEHAQQSCGNLLNLTLECLDIHKNDDSSIQTFDKNPCTNNNASKYVINPSAHKAALLIGTCHGLTNGLRTAIPVVSHTGKIIIPQELCHKYNVKSPRYLLSALGQGDVKGREAFRSAVCDIVLTARAYLEQAREERESIFEYPEGEKAIAALLPGLAAETFLNRLEVNDYDLTSRDLRQIGPLEHLFCSFRIVKAWRNGAY